MDPISLEHPCDSIGRDTGYIVPDNVTIKKNVKIINEKMIVKTGRVDKQLTLLRIRDPLSQQLLEHDRQPHRGYS